MDENKESKDMEKLAENKLLILYLLDKANCTLSNLQIQRLLYDIDGFNYYYFQHIIAELISQKYVSSYNQDNELLYDITPEGKEILDLTNDALPGIVKLKLDNIIEKELPDVKMKLLLQHNMFLRMIMNI